MSTTTIRLPDELKVRVAQAAERAGTTPHAFILEAIAEKTHDEEERAAFAATARERFERIVEGGPTVSWSDARRYLEARAAGQAAKRPAARKRAR
ncbi:CopG family transcriptional regulator [Aquincola sp. S2]|uniref:CopG family transcriptional regulator n=1 Tax=Pseudaquabacterium terrae TaxID=2732868 RepID=A0ABX2ECJ6_9BURK|nr:CopG family transcriptional regulator [Aquabacterium terrae]NRF66179.1 CopG family transcriptional regulator [Aquabacterium terrae]